MPLPLRQLRAMFSQSKALRSGIKHVRSGVKTTRSGFRSGVKKVRRLVGNKSIENATSAARVKFERRSGVLSNTKVHLAKLSEKHKAVHDDILMSEERYDRIHKGIDKAHDSLFKRMDKASIESKAEDVLLKLKRARKDARTDIPIGAAVTGSIVGSVAGGAYVGSRAALRKDKRLKKVRRAKR